MSKTLAEKTAWKFAEEHSIDLVTVIPSLMAGPSLTPDIPSSVGMATCLLSGTFFKPKIECRNFFFLPIFHFHSLIWGFDIGILKYFAGNEFLINSIKGMQMLSGSISISHVEDVCRAHVFLAEKESASGRYICCAVNTSVPELAKFLSNKYPHHKVPTE